jgi:hypothetical protein
LQYIYIYDRIKWRDQKSLSPDRIWAIAWEKSRKPKNGDIIMTTYFGFALANSMFSGDCIISRQAMHLENSEKQEIEASVNCCNASHSATVEAAKEKFGLRLEIPEKPPTVALKQGDSIIVMGVRGLPRLTDRHHYTAEEIEAATFEFVKYTVG